MNSTLAAGRTSEIVFGTGNVRTVFGLEFSALSVSELENLGGPITARLTELRERELADAFERLDEV